MLKNKSLLITGGTGSLGRSITSYLLQKTEIRRIIIFSRDELKQQEMKEIYKNDLDRLRFFVGDIRELDRLKRALHDVNFLIHAAALKQVDTGEYNPLEFIKTNVIGSSNVIDACIDSSVERVIALSTDKASSPINLYGATKLTADKLFIAANNYVADKETIFSVVRYGNVMGSRGSVIPYFKYLHKNGEILPITDSRMTRFWISLTQATEFVLKSLLDMQGGELFVPKIPSFKITDLARAITGSDQIREIGLRPGEKLHEEMISIDDSRRTIDQSNRYVICPTVPKWNYLEPDGNGLIEGFNYRSDLNSEWLSVADLQRLIGDEKD